MIGRKKLSAIREELRHAFAASGQNPIVDLDREIRKLKRANSTSPKDLETLESFRRALAQVVEEPTKPAKSKGARTKKAI